MSKLNIPTLTVGMVVVTPTTFIHLLTPDKKYVVDKVEGEWIEIVDDSNSSRFYRSHLFIEADVYYSMILYLTLVRLYNLNFNNMK